MLADIASRLQPGGAFILTVPNGRYLTEILCRPSYRLKQTAWGRRLVQSVKSAAANKDLTTDNQEDPHVNFFTLPQLEHLFAEHGLQVVTFHRLFLRWVVWETFFGPAAKSDAYAARDFERSQSAPPARCACWSFLLRRAS